MPTRTARRATLFSALILLAAGGPATSGASASAASGGGGTPATARMSSDSAAPAVSETQTVKLTRSQVKSVQRRAKVRADGALGAKTRTALKRYQSKKRLARTGRPNLQTLKAMKLAFAEKIEQKLVAKQRTTASGPSTVDGYMFPIQGPWSPGGSATGFGARSGAHQGVDLLSTCGTPVAAASSGTVKTNTTQSAAGNYVVITDTPSGQDQVYMHLQSASPLKVGDRVDTGTPVGSIGNTGNATACLLHFELWSAPGWFEGGKPQDPGADLAAWGRTDPER